MKQIQIQISKEYYDLVPRPTKDQYNSLKHSIMEDGLHLPIIVNPDGIILDGYTRYQICQELGITPEYEIKNLPTNHDERRFVIITNLSRRHLTLFQKAEVIKNWWIEQREYGFKIRGNNTWKTRRGKNYKPKERLNKRVAKMLGCSHNTACSLLYLLRKADSRTKQKLRTGSLAVATAERLVREKLNEVGHLHTKFDGTNYLRHHICLSCGGKTQKVEDCHVHTQICCKECRWGI